MRPPCWQVAIAGMLCGAAHAADGYFDPAWGNGGGLQVDVSSGDDEGRALLVQRDGKLLLAGACIDANGTFSFCATRLLPNGAYDPAFGPAGLGYLTFSIFPGFPPFSYFPSAALLPGGGSVFADVTDRGNNLIAKLAENGASVQQRDFSFASGMSSVFAVAVQPDGKIVAVGVASRPDLSNTDFGVARFLPDLSFDTGFGTGGTRVIAFDLGGPTVGGADVGRAVTLQADGKIVIAGTAKVGNDSYAAVARLNADGQLDATFGSGGRKSFSWSPNHRDEVNAVAVDRNGTLLVAGTSLVGIGAPDLDFAVSRFAPDGSFDPVFGLQCPPPFCESGTVIVDLAGNFGAPTHDAVRALAVQSDGKILLAGDAKYTTIDQRMFATARLTRNGDVDLDYGHLGMSGGGFGITWNTDSAAGLAFANGGLMVAGYSRAVGGSDLRFGIGRLQMDLIFTDGFDP